MKINFKRFIAAALSSVMIFSSFAYSAFAEETTAVNSENETVSLAAVKMNVNAGGWKESVFAEWLPVSGAAKYEVFVKKSSEGETAYEKIDDELIRQYPTYWRADVVGLAKGEYDLRISTLDSNGIEIAWSEQKGIDVIAYNRIGFAFSDKSPFKSSSGAYNDDGTLKDGAVVLYVTKDTAKTVTAEMIVDGKNQTVTGIGNILSNFEKGTKQSPICVRIIGEVKAGDMDLLDKSEGLQMKGPDKNKIPFNLTIEGIGNDATIHGFGLYINKVTDVEVRNLGVMTLIDDGISIDGASQNLWIHNVDIFYGPNKGGDQKKGDGALDIKGLSTYVTFSENHFWDTGKSSMCGMKESNYGEYYVTYANNWFDHADSRHPRIRGGNVHMLNNYFDGNAKYGVGITSGGSAFVENNYFRSVNDPMLISLQGTDAAGEGTFSGEDGGYIKEYGNIISGSFKFITGEDAYCAKTRDEKVPDTYSAKVVSNNVRYTNFDTSDKMYDYTPLSANNVPTYVVSNAGRLNHGDFTWEFDNATEDKNYNVIDGLRNALDSYTQKVVSVGGTVTGTASGEPSSLTGIDGYKNSYDPVAKLNGLNLPNKTETSKLTAGDPKNLASGSAPSGETTYALKLQASDFSGSKVAVSAETNVKGFTIIPKTDDKSDPVKTDSSKGVMTYGTGSKTNRAIKFTTTDKGLLYITAGSNSSSAPNRLIKIEDENGTVLTDAEFKTPVSNSAVSLPAAGTYYVYSGDNGVNISFLGVVYGEAEVPDEPVYDNTDGFSYTAVEPAAAISPSKTSTPKSTNGPDGEVINPIDPVDPDDSIHWGDVSGDNYIKANDAALILEYILDKDALSKKEDVVFRAHLADVNGDDHITAADAAMILAKCLNADFKFPGNKDWVEGNTEKSTESSTEKSTESSTEKTTESSTEKTTESSTEKTTEPSTGGTGDDDINTSGSAIIYNFSDDAFADVVNEKAGGKEYNINGVSIWALNDVKTDKTFDIDGLHLTKSFKINTNNNDFILNKKAPTKNALGITLKAGDKVTIYVRPTGNDAAGQVLLTKAADFNSDTKDFTSSTGDPQKLEYIISEDGDYYISAATKGALIYAIIVK